MKLKPIDLHIGGWYNSVKFNKPVQLQAEDIYELVARADGADISHYISEMFEPITLTEEWLVKFEFENWGNDEYGYTRYVLHNVIDGTSDFEIHINKNNHP